MNRDLNIMDYEDDEIVPESMACPKCGNRIMDELVCTGDDTVKCAACGAEYDSSNPEGE